MQSPSSEIEDARDREMSDRERHEINNADNYTRSKIDMHIAEIHEISPSLRIRQIGVDDGAEGRMIYRNVYYSMM